MRPAPSGAPEAFIAGRPRRMSSLSLSHSDGTAFCALAAAGASLGCDVEKVEPHSAAFLADYFTAEEQDLVARQPGRRPRDRADPAVEREGKRAESAAVRPPLRYPFRGRRYRPVCRRRTIRTGALDRQPCRRPSLSRLVAGDRWFRLDRNRKSRAAGAHPPLLLRSPYLHDGTSRKHFHPV